MNKRGFFFTIIAVGLVLILLALFLTYQIRDTKTEVTVDQVRVQTMASFADATQKQFIKTIFKTYTRGAIREAEKSVQNSAIDNPKDFIANAIFTVSLDDGSGNFKTFGETIDDIVALAQDSGMVLNLEYSHDGVQYFPLNSMSSGSSYLDVSQSDPWNLNIKKKPNADLRLTLTSTTPHVKIERTINLNEDVDLRGFAKDPIALRSGKDITIKESTYLPSSFDSTTLKNTIIPNQEFFARSGAPSYLDRFKTSVVSTDGNGIERLVSSTESGGNLNHYSLTDWHFFTSFATDANDCVSDISQGGSCNGNDPDYRLDDGLISFYSGLTWCTCSHSVVDCTVQTGDSDGFCEDNMAACNSQCSSRGGAAGISGPTPQGNWCDKTDGSQGNFCCLCQDDVDASGKYCTEICVSKGDPYTNGQCFDPSDPLFPTSQFCYSGIHSCQAPDGSDRAAEIALDPTSEGNTRDCTGVYECFCYTNTCCPTNSCSGDSCA